MAFEFLDKLKAGFNRVRTTNWAYTLGSKLGKWSGLTIDQTSQEFINRGFPENRSRISQIYNYFNPIEESFYYFADTNPDHIPDVNRIEELPSLWDRFGYVVQYDVYDFQGELVGTRTSMVQTSELFSQNELFPLLPDLLRDQSPLMLGQSQNFTIRGAFKNTLNFGDESDVF